MDQSETYIKMCEKAGEIQEIKPKPFEGCYYYQSTRGWTGVQIWCVHDVEFYGQPVMNDDIWLPRQDQLQEMIGDTPYYNTKNAMWSVLDDLRNFAFGTNFKEYIPLSMEQLWLAFVMKERYNKTWDGNEWKEVT